MIFVKNKVLFGLETQCFCRQITCVVFNVHSSCRHYNRSGGTFMYCITHILTCTLSSFVIDQLTELFTNRFMRGIKNLCIIANLSPSEGYENMISSGFYKFFQHVIWYWRGYLHLGRRSGSYYPPEVSLWPISGWSFHTYKSLSNRTIHGFHNFE